MRVNKFFKITFQNLLTSSSSIVFRTALQRPKVASLCRRFAALCDSIFSVDFLTVIELFETGWYFALDWLTLKLVVDF